MGKTCNIKSETCGSKCTGYDGHSAKSFSVKEGDNLWTAMHTKFVDAIACDTCKEDGKKRISGLHDAVTVSIGENAFDSKNFNEFADWVQCARAKCKKDGRC